MCSTDTTGLAEPERAAQPDRFAELGRAIDDLATRARAAQASQTTRKTGLAGEEDWIAARLAELWSLIAELDPEIARRLPTYRLD